MATGNNNKKKTSLSSVQALYEQARAQFLPGGASTKGVEAALARAGDRAVSAGTQNLVSSGLAGTTMAGGLGNKFAEEVAAPTLMQAESDRSKNLANIDMQYANMLQQLELSKQQTDTQRGNYQQQGSITAAMANKPRTSVVDTGYADRVVASKVTTGGGNKTRSTSGASDALRALGYGTTGSSTPSLSNTMSSGPSTITMNGKTYTMGADGIVRSAGGQQTAKKSSVAYASPWVGPN